MHPLFWGVVQAAQPELQFAVVPGQVVVTVTCWGTIPGGTVALR
jgi:hypothetical protein